MTKKNERMNVIRDNFFETYLQEHPEIQDERDIPNNYKIVWRTMIRKAGDDFLYMDEENMQGFLVKVVAREGLSYFTRYNYFVAYRKILAFMKEGGNITVNYEDWEYNTIFGYNSKNKNNKTNNSDNSLKEYKALMNSIKQEKEMCEQEIKNLNERHEQDIKNLNEQHEQKIETYIQRIKNLDERILDISNIIDYK